MTWTSSDFLTEENLHRQSFHLKHQSQKNRRNVLLSHKLHRKIYLFRQIFRFFVNFANSPRNDALLLFEITALHRECFATASLSVREDADVVAINGALETRIAEAFYICAYLGLVKRNFG